MADLEGATVRNGIIGAIVTLVAYAVPVLNAIAPIAGGGVAGYLQHEGAGGGMKVGAVTGIFTTLPLLIVVLVASGFVAQIPVIGEVLAGAVVVLVVIFVVLHAIVLGLVGGLLGGLVSGSG